MHIPCQLPSISNAESLLSLLRYQRALLFTAFSQSWSEPRSRWESGVLHSLRVKTIHDEPVFNFILNWLLAGYAVRRQ